MSEGREYDGWVFERERDGGVLVRLRKGSGALWNAVLGAAVVAGGLWLGTLSNVEGVAGSVILVGGLWVLLAGLAWAGTRELRVGDEDVAWSGGPGEGERWPRSAVAAVRLFRWQSEGRARFQRWRVELDASGDDALTVGFRFAERMTAEAFARRLAGVLEVPLRVGAPRQEGGPDAVPGEV